MPQEEFVHHAGALFSIVGPQITKAEIDAVFPGLLPGRDDLVKFYLLHNGGSRTELGGTVYCGNPNHRVQRDHLEKLKVEGFFSISPDPKVRMLGLRSMTECHATRLRIYAGDPGMKDFLENHLPIAWDHSGNYLWIELKSGRVSFLDWDRCQEESVEIATSFSEFVAKFWNGASGGCPTSDPIA